MRWRRRPSDHVERPVFDDAAAAGGFVLDGAQSRAADLLAGGADHLYLWGPVGRGKSWLMATYFDAVPTRRKVRTHFHEFFRDLHHAIVAHRADLGAALDDLLGDAEVICFDEFHVHDPADGIFIDRVLTTLFDRPCRLVVTSNHPPSGLMPNPLFHSGFLPTIAKIEASMRVISVDGPRDYRQSGTSLRPDAGFTSGAWIAPGTWDQLSRLGLPHPSASDRVTLRPATHDISAWSSEGRLWIDFSDLCVGATAPSDYLWLTERFPTWVITGIPAFADMDAEAAQRFANVVDVRYDRDARTYFVAASALDSTSHGSDMPREGERIMSRLKSTSACSEE